MTGTIGKKFGQLRQWTSERIGNVDRTNAPDEFRIRDMETETRKKGVETLVVAVGDYAKTLDKRSTQERQLSVLAMLSKTCSQLGHSHGDRSSYGMMLIKVGEAQEALQKHQSTFAASVRNGLLLETSSLAACMKEYSALKKKLENRRLDFDAKQNRLNRSKKEKPSLESEVTTAQTKYNETLADMQQLMSVFSEREELLLEPLMEFAKAQYEYFANGLKELEELQVFLQDDNMRNRINENNQNPERAEMRKAALGFSDKNLKGAKSNDDLRPEEPTADSSNSQTAWVKDDQPISKDEVGTASKSSDHSKKNIVRDKLSISGPYAPIAVIPRSVSLEAVAELGAQQTKSNEPVLTKSQTRISDVTIDRSGEYVEAMYSFEGSGLGEMKMMKGDIIKVLRRIDDGWWVGEYPGRKSGMFPSNYVRPFKKEDKNSILSPSKEASPSELTNISGLKLGSTKNTSSIAVHKEEASMPDCKDCGCSEYSANVYKAGFCKNCFHKH